MQITLLDGSKKNIIIERMGAMEGWDMQRRYTEFVMSKDKDFRAAFTMDVLSHAKVDQGGDQKLPLTTGALIDNHLQTWTNVKEVFEEVLRHNGIDPETHAENPGYWANAGGEMAAAFLGATIELMGPLLQGKSTKE